MPPKKRTPNNKNERSDLPILLLAGILMTASLALAVEIIQRMWRGGPDHLSIISTVATVILTSSPLTGRGRELATWLLDLLQVRAYQRGITTLAIASIAFILILGIRISLPLLATFYNQQGYELYTAGKLTAAQNSFARAVSLNPDYSSSLYNLADAYVDIGDYDKAYSLYKEALSADRTLDLAYNGMGYTLIRQGRNVDAILILYAGLDIAQDDMTRLAILANLGRAYLANSRPLEAEEMLNKALKIDSRDASANCTLASVYEVLEKPNEQVKVAWEKCLAYAVQSTPRHQEMAATARAHLRVLEEK